MSELSQDDADQLQKKKSMIRKKSLIKDNKASQLLALYSKNKEENT